MNMPVPYTHEPFTDFTIDDNKQAFRAALEKVTAELGNEYTIKINGEQFTTEHKATSTNPANIAEVVGTVSQANIELAEKAVQTAYETFQTWQYSDPQLRAQILHRAAAIIRRRKHEFSAWLVKEAGKPWNEADADTAECIDFLEFYARQMVELAQGKPVHSRVGEHNTFTYRPLGVGIIIAPFNFPLAIMAGTTVAALVTGNTAVLKPAEGTPVIAAKFVEVMEEAGLPTGVLSFLPGQGSEIGDYLVDHVKTRFVSFTGSRAVGCRIYERASKVHDGQIWLKRVIAEMGGKDTIIVDSTADLELAATSIVKSAFGFSGQKCSACSRAVIHQDVYDEVLAMVVAKTKELTVGNPAEGTHFMGPVIDDRAFKKITSYIEIGKGEGRVVAGGEYDDSTGYFIQPTVIADVAEDARLMKEEIFGPVVAICKATDFDHMLQIANNTDYGLTGAIISNNMDHVARAKREFFVGNLYVNRGCTGAIVGYQPFGGFNMSGTDSKAGSPDYLTLHMQAQTISELY